MTLQQKQMIVQDFEKYMRYTLQRNIPFTLESFAAFATSLINFYGGSNLIATSERREAALILVGSFNAGVGNRITQEDLNQIADLIVSESTIDYSILNPIFSATK
ncbi:hypothetical protein [Sphingobacterium gobiense]|uniref:Uncharacterized protein n=1 Tax=Sphingobacterium gobiense TaxID=1382456 RepID=A0A2S9JSW9_9SPHI|nr:hypothetical protein [Sphingobacterium gobiense]PRD56369.1 hypothetical protein C5749_03665 [Sphingobacterium gobiense]